MHDTPTEVERLARLAISQRVTAQTRQRERDRVRRTRRARRRGDGPLDG